jgi:4-hydroxybenzoate polyprenyltransferase
MPQRLVTSMPPGSGRRLRRRRQLLRVRRWALAVNVSTLTLLGGTLAFGIGGMPNPVVVVMALAFAASVCLAVTLDRYLDGLEQAINRAAV